MNDSTSATAMPYAMLLCGAKLCDVYTAVAPPSKRAAAHAASSPHERWTVPAPRDLTIPADAL